MTEAIYKQIEGYMLVCMEDSAHDSQHIYRVLANAMEIAKREERVDYDVLICACLLHDIGRKEQFEDPALCHAQVGADKAYRFLVEHNFTKEFAEQVKHCIICHRFRKTNEPQTTEARILFDADKLEAAGTIGIARTLIYKGEVAEPLYSVGADGHILCGEEDTEPSFVHEYKHKLEKIYDKFYTARGKELALQRQKTAQAFFESLMEEVSDMRDAGEEELWKHLEKSGN